MSRAASDASAGRGPKVKLFDCRSCGQTLYFENTRCEQCGHRLGYDPSTNDMVPLERTDSELDDLKWHAATDTSRKFKFCANAAYDVCNWLMPASETGIYCLACRHNHTVPDLAKADNLQLWRHMEFAKHRLFYTLMRLGLPLVTRAEDGKEGLMFDFKEDESPTVKVLTGHDLGDITINIAEADDAEREKRRAAMHEPYRTLLGHFRHEVGHYYWDRLVRDAPAIGPYREIFGDESEDYNSALQRHYNQGPPMDWRDHYVSAYATTHPWEDFAETWAHYLHIVDTLETARTFGVKIHPTGVAEAEALSTEVDFAPYKAESIEPIVKAWVPLTFAINSLNRSMGLRDFYPFVLTSTIIEKLGFVHDLVHGWVGAERRAQPDIELSGDVPASNVA